MSKKKKRKQSKINHEMKERITFFLFLCFLTISLGSYIIVSDSFQPKVNELTASYISLNNHNTTDILKITNLKKMSNRIGKSIQNKESLSFQITGEKDKDYQIIVVPISNQIDEKYIHYSLSINKDNITNTLNKVQTQNNHEKMIYQGKYLDTTNIEIKMWIDKEYSGKVKNNSFEVKIKMAK